MTARQKPLLCIVSEVEQKCHYESYGLVRILQVSSAVEYPGDVQDNDIGYRHAALKPASAVIQRKVLLSRGSSKKL